MNEIRIALDATINMTPYEEVDQSWNVFDQSGNTDGPGMPLSSDLLDISGTGTGFTFFQTDNANQADGNSGVNSVGSGDAAWVNVARAMQEYWFSTSQTTARKQGVGNVPGGTYTIEFTGSRAGVSAGERITRIIVGDSAQTFDPADNVSEVARFTGVEPDTNGEIRWDILADADTDSSHSFVGAIRIIPEGPAASPGIPATTLENADGTLSTGTEVTRTITRVSDGTELFIGSQTTDSETGELPEIDLSETAAEVDDEVDDRVTLDTPASPGVVSTTVRRTVGDLGEE